MRDWSDRSPEHQRAKAEKERRQKALTRFALDFLKANLDDLREDGMLDAFGNVTSTEIDELKQSLGVQFS